MHRTLNIKRKLGFVTGTIQHPKDETFTKAWDRCSDAIMAWLFKSIDPSLVSGLTYCKTAIQLWDELRFRFTKENKAEIFRIERYLNETQQSNLSVNEYYTKLMALYEELDIVDPPVPCTCAADNDVLARWSDRRVYKFLIGLDSSYQYLCSLIPATDLLPTLASTFSLICDEEDSRQITPGIELKDDGVMVVMGYGSHGRNNRGKRNDKKSFNKQGVLGSVPTNLSQPALYQSNFGPYSV